MEIVKKEGRGEKGGRRRKERGRKGGGRRERKTPFSPPPMGSPNMTILGLIVIDDQLLDKS